MKTRGLSFLLVALVACEGAGGSDDAGPGGAVNDIQKSCSTQAAPGCGMVEVTGSFEPMQLGHVGDPGDPNLCRSPAYVTGDLYVDAHEVTVARFRRFLAESDVVLDDLSEVVVAGAERIALWQLGFPHARELNAPLAESLGGNWTDTPGAREDHPVSGVDFVAALTFCYWDSDGFGRLPTEAEHEYLVRYRSVEGAVSGRAYAWGDEPVSECDRAQVLGCPGEDGAATRRAGSFPPSGGLFDLTGNLEELALDNWQGYDAGVCWYAPNDGALEDPVCGGGYGDGGFKSSRGGAYDADHYGGWRRTRRGDGHEPTVGFRCVRSLPRSL